MGVVDAIDITAAHRKTLLSLLRRYLPGAVVWAFGSRVKWTSRPDSDLDLVVFSKPEQRERVSLLKEAFEESSLPFRIDLLVWDDIPESFQQNIRKEYAVLVDESKDIAVPTAPTFAHSATKKNRMSEWRLSTWGDEISLEYGKALRNYQTEVGSVRVYGSNGPIGWTTEPLAEGPGVILGRKGAYRGVQYSATPFFVIDTAYYVVPKTELDMRWLYYAAIHFKLGELDDGSPIPSTTRSAVYMLDIAVPSIDEQRAIAHILGTLDDKIDLNRRMNATLEATARAIFQSWFVDFDPVRAKAAGRSPVGMAPEVAALFPDGFEDSELGEIPRGWRLSTLDAVSRLNPEAWSKATRPDQIAYLDLSNTKWGVIETVTEYSSVDAPSRAQRVLRLGDTIIGTVRPGNGSFAYIDREGLTGSTGFAVLRPLETEYSEFIYLAATEPENIDRLSLLADGGAYPAVRPEVVLDTAVVFPRKEVLEQFSRQIAPFFALFAENERQSQTLAILRDALLPRLMSGELPVSETSGKSAKAA